MAKTTEYRPPKWFKENYNISSGSLKKYRLAKKLRHVKWSCGTKKVGGQRKGKPYYDVAEVKKLFYLN